MLKWAVCLFRAPYVSSLGCKHRPGAVRLVLAQYLSSLGRTHGPRSMRVALAPYESSLCRTYRPWAVRIVLGCTRRCWAARFRLSHGVGKRSSRWGCPTRRWSPLLYCRGSPGRRGYAGRFVHLRYGVALKDINGEKMKEGRAKTSHDICRGSLRDAPAGPPTSWVPP